MDAIMQNMYKLRVTYARRNDCPFTYTFRFISRKSIPTLEHEISLIVYLVLLPRFSFQSIQQMIRFASDLY